MSELDLNSPMMGRRGLLRACVLLTLGGAVFRFPHIVTRPSVDKTEFVLVHGWVLPAQYFRQAQT